MTTTTMSRWPTLAMTPIRWTTVTATMSDLLSPAAAGALLGVGPDRIAQLVRDGVLQAVLEEGAVGKRTTAWEISITT